MCVDICSILACLILWHTVAQCSCLASLTNISVVVLLHLAAWFYSSPVNHDVQVDGPMSGKSGMLTSGVDRYGDSAPIQAGYNPV